jgi:hypothetical protein
MPRSNVTNVELLQQGGVLDPASLSQQEKHLINDLSESEVQTLITIRQKVGDYSPLGHPEGVAWIL